MKGEVRIIGGKWRGRKLTVPKEATVRPTPDRVRETLFNWLMRVLPGAYCLDAFAGTGVLGFEALSRGAAHVTMIDQSKNVIFLLKEELKKFDVEKENANIYQGVLPKELKKPSQAWDIVFLDPPYQMPLLLPMCFYLENQGYLANPAHIYIESPAPIEDTMLPTSWKIIKSKKAGMVAYHLVQRLV